MTQNKISLLTASSSTSYVTPFANDVLCVEIGGDGVVDVALGSDDERALVNAFKIKDPYSMNC